MLIDPVLSIKMSYTRSWDSAKKHLAGKLPCQVFFVKLSLREAARTAVAIRPPVFPVIANRRDTRPRVSAIPFSSVGNGLDRSAHTVSKWTMDNG